eukprot:scaffold222640_cov18-Tisochrysis_lutea.AAC.1
MRPVALIYASVCSAPPNSGAHPPFTCLVLRHQEGLIAEALAKASVTAHLFIEGPSDEALAKATVTAHLVRQADGQAVMDPIKVSALGSVRAHLESWIACIVSRKVAQNVQLHSLFPAR